MVMKILVSGGTGFLGSWICRELSKDHDIRILTRQDSNSWRISDIEKIGLFVGDIDGWKTYLKDFSPDVLLLFGWNGVGNRDRNSNIQRQNLSWISEIASVAKVIGTRKVICLGSQAELGSISDTIFENQRDNPTSQYGMAKVEVRQYLTELFKNSKTKFVWARIFSTYGPLDIGEWLIPQIVDSLGANKRIPLTKGEQDWSYLHAYDLSEAFKLLIANEIDGIVNVGNIETVKIKDVAQIVAAELGSKSNLLGFGEIPYRVDQVMHLKPACETLISIGWMPRVSLSSGLKQTVLWLNGSDARRLNLDNSRNLDFTFPPRPQTSK